jgi:TPR repeat protein
MTRPGVAEIEFPIVVLGEAMLTGVRVERMPALDREERFAVGQQRDEALDILSDARADEASERRLEGVMVRFLRRDFSGASFGLALALADKRARYAAPAGRMIATGSLPCGGRGALAAVDGFDAKVRCVLSGLEGVGPPPVFACAGANLRAASESTRTALAEAEKSGRIVVRAVEQVGDLADLWGGANPGSASPTGAWRTWRALAGGGLAILLVAAGLGWWQASQGAPLRACEAALEAIEAEAARDRAGIATAVDRCGAAAAAMPRSGRALFLAAQSHALNGGDRLASAYWKRAALAGDREGLAAHGRDLWLSGPGDPDSMRTALQFLNAAADKGSAAALEDMAEIYRDGIGVSADLGRAETLLNRAEQVRKEQRK